MAAGQAEPQVDPGVADLQAVFTAIGAGRYFFYLIEMSAVHDALDHPQISQITQITQIKSG